MVLLLLGLTEVNLVTLEFSATCQDFNASVFRSGGTEYALTEEEHTVLATSMDKALPWGNFSYHVVRSQQFTFVMTLPSFGTVGLAPVTLTAEIKYVHEDTLPFRGLPLNYSVFYVFDQIEAALKVISFF